MVCIPPSPHLAVPMDNLSSLLYIPFLAGKASVVYYEEDQPPVLGLEDFFWRQVNTTFILLFPVDGLQLSIMYALLFGQEYDYIPQRFKVHLLVYPPSLPPS